MYSCCFTIQVQDHSVLLWWTELWRMVSEHAIYIYRERSILVVSHVHKFSNSLVPNAPPDNVQAITRSSTAVLVTWDPVPEIDRNGIITQYEVEFNQSTFNEISTSNLTTTNGSQLMVELEGLEEYVEYTVRVRVYTSVGPGPFSVAVMNRTLEDGE